MESERAEIEPGRKELESTKRINQRASIFNCSGPPLPPLPPLLDANALLHASPPRPPEAQRRWCNHLLALAFFLLSLCIQLQIRHTKCSRETHSLARNTSLSEMLRSCASCSRSSRLSVSVSRQSGRERHTGTWNAGFGCRQAHPYTYLDYVQIPGNDKGPTGLSFSGPLFSSESRVTLAHA